MREENYFARIGRRGGQKSRRVLTPDQARAMVRAREEKRKNRRPQVGPQCLACELFDKTELECSKRVCEKK